jgi:hypothetical protein
MPQYQVIQINSEKELKEILREVVRSELSAHFGNLPKDTSDFIGTKDAQKILGISSPTMTKYVRMGFLKRYRIGHTYRYKKDEVIKCLQSMPSVKHSRNY